MTPEDFAQIVSEVFGEYLPKIKTAERRVFIDALVDELQQYDFFPEEEVERDESDVESLFDSYDDEA